MTINSNIIKVKGESRFIANPYDLFATPHSLVDYFVPSITLASLGGRVLDVGCGDKVWANAVTRSCPDASVTTIDLDPQWNPDIVGSFLDHEVAGNYEVLIGNPPFGSKDDKHLATHIVEHALCLDKSKYLRPRQVLFLLSTDFVSGGDRYNSIFSKCPPLFIYHLSDRINFRFSKLAKEYVRGSNTTLYSVFDWRPNASATITMTKWVKNPDGMWR